MSATGLIYELHVSLVDVTPAVWRRVRVPGDVALARFHRVLQSVMGWEDRHPWAIEAAGRRYGVPESEWDDLVPAKGVRLAQLAPDAGMTFAYEYGLDAAWEHVVRVDKILPFDPGARLPRCIAGARACPPEDVGGPWAYEELVAESATGVDADYFDLAAVNERLGRLR